MTLLNPCIRACGPKGAKIVAVGEAPGAQEEIAGIPFVGGSGQEFDRMLLQVGLRREDLYLTNVLWTRPPDNKMEHFCVKKAELPPGYTLPPLQHGYLHPDLLPELERLHEEVRQVAPNLILALGGTALWAFTGNHKISSFRGTILKSGLGKVLPTFHPAYVLRDWSARPIVVLDLTKAAFECTFPDVVYPERFVTIDPSPEEAEAWITAALGCAAVACDVETRLGQISILGFASSWTEALSIPFLGPDGSSFYSREDEIKIRCLANSLLTSPKVKKIFQNGLYDLQYLLREGFKVRNVSDDTMLMQHALWPELPKSLGFLGSTLTNDRAWKTLRPRGEQLKKEE